jgi:hypothetical protein
MYGWRCSPRSGVRLPLTCGVVHCSQHGRGFREIRRSTGRSSVFMVRLLVARGADGFTRLSARCQAAHARRFALRAVADRDRLAGDRRHLRRGADRADLTGCWHGGRANGTSGRKLWAVTRSRSRCVVTSRMRQPISVSAVTRSKDAQRDTRRSAGSESESSSAYSHVVPSGSSMITMNSEPSGRGGAESTTFCAPE